MHIKHYSQNQKVLHDNILSLLKNFKMKYKKINEAIRELALVSTAYGIPNIFRSEHLFNKTLWLTFLISLTDLLTSQLRTVASTMTTVVRINQKNIFK